MPASVTERRPPSAISDCAVVKIRCKYVDCEAEAVFLGRDRKVALARAREAGWTVSGGHYRCPEHRGLKAG